MRITLLILGCSFSLLSCIAQPLQRKKILTLQDTLRGSVTAERAWWDVIKYDITVEPDFSKKSIKGSNIITFKALSSEKKMQIDLQQPMEIQAVTVNNKRLPAERMGNVYFINFPTDIKKGTTVSMQIDFQGQPREAIYPPWDGGWIWKKDANGNPWMSVACQGLGASVWYPCKDHQSDEPDSATLSIVVSSDLMAVGNGRLRNQMKNSNGKDVYTWAVTNPINAYNIVPYIGRYVHWGETFTGEKGSLDLDYWVLDYNMAKAKRQFTQVPLMLTCFERWFGPYPFYEDGYKLVESPHLGMEHQSAIAYGNKFENGYLGKDLSGTGWGTKWDFIIVHESAHEWFANSITSKDIADMWIHEGFASYSETLFTDCEYGVEAGNEYCIGSRRSIANDIPVIGKYGVNREGSTDMYPKAASLIHMIRQLFKDDEKFRLMLRGLSAEFYHQTVTTAQVESFISQACGRDLSPVFDQYLRTTRIPLLEYKTGNDSLSFRWTNCVGGFNMPVKINAGKELWIQPTEEWTTMPSTADNIKADKNFYIQVKKTN